MIAGRQLGMYHEQYIVMWSLLVLTLVVFGKGIYDRFKVWQVGQPEDRWNSPHASWKRFISNSFGHLRLLRDKYPGIMHWLIFWGFVVFAIGTLSVMLEEDFKIPIYRGNYYLVLSFLLDIFGAAAIIGLIMALWRRYVIKPERLDSNPDDGVALLLILSIIITGSPAEAASGEEMARAIGKDRAVSVAGLTTLRELAVLYTLADVMITNDSGPAHFACLTNIDVVVLFGPETPTLYGPLGNRSHVIWAGLACSPCVSAFNHRLSPCRDNVCMRAITVEQVYAKTMELLERRKDG